MTDPPFQENEEGNMKTKKVIALCILVAFVSSFATYACSQSLNHESYLNELPASATYTIKTDGINYWAVRYDRKVFFTSINAASVFQNVNDDLPSGGEIHVQKGRYVLSSRFNVSDNIKVSGEGFGTILCAANGLEEPVVYVSSDRVMLSDFQIDGNSAGQTEADTYGIEIYQAQNFAVKNVLANDTGADGIFVSNSHNGTLSDLQMVNTGNHAVLIGYSSSYITLEGLVSNNPKTEHLCIEWTCDGGGVEAYNHHITASNIVGKNGNNQAIYIRDANDTVISNAVLENTTNSGVYVKDTNRITLSNIQTYHSGSFPFTVQASSNETSIVNCIAGSSSCPGFELRGRHIILSDSRTYGVTEPVSMASTSHDILISNNEFEQFSSQMYLQSGSSNIRLIGNSWTNPIGTPAQLIYVFAGGFEFLIADNDLNAPTSGKKILCQAGASPTTKVKGNLGFATENSVSGANTTATAAVINHGLAGTPTCVWCSFDTLAVTGYTWTATSTQITVTITGTLPASWTVYVKCEYIP